MKRCAQWLADRIAWYRWGYMCGHGWTFADYRRVTNICRTSGKPVYSRGVCAWLGNP